MTKQFPQLRVGTIIALIVASFCGPLSLPAPALATGGPTFTTAPAASALISTATPITGLQITATGNPTEPVKLQVQHGSLSMTTTTGLTFNTATSGTTIGFSGTVSDLNAALATLQYTGGALGSDTLEASMVAGDQIYDPTTGHVYEYVTSDGNVDWNQSKVLADARSYSGAPGYLATMTSADENSYIAARLSGAAWMGASDAAVEGDWKWVDGPENGTSFYSGLGNSGGHTVGGNYANWNSGEPNDSGGNEDCGQFLGGNGLWNDLPCSGFTLPGYVTEYGDNSHALTVATTSVAITVTGATHTIATCTDLQTYGADTNTRFDTFNLTSDIDCSGIDFSPLYQSDGFSGTLNGHGHKITNLTINRPSDGNVGLISYTNPGSVIENLTLQSGSVTGNYYVGAVSGETYGAIDNVISHLDINATYYSGGLIGTLEDYDAGTSASVTNSAATGNVTVTDGYSGGLIGYTDCEDATCTIEHSYATGNVTGPGGSMGGLVGYVYQYASSHVGSTTFTNDYARGDVSSPSDERVGGLIGYVTVDNGGASSTVNIQHTYASGTTTANQSAGGLIGLLDWENDSNDTINLEHSFATGHVSASLYTGGLVGLYNLGPQPAASTDNYFDLTGTAQTDCGGAHPLPNCSGVNAAGADPGYFKDNHTSAPMNTWDFSTIWVTNTNDYPTFAVADDGDGIPAAVEEAAPNNGDANNDGIPDDAEANISSFVDPVTGHYVTVALSDACSNTGESVATEASKPAQDAGYDYPAGLLAFSSDCGTNGYTATVHLFYYGVTTSNLVARKYNATTHGYSTIPGATITHPTIGGQAVTELTYNITDGGPLDQDGTANGIIVDPVGLGQSAVGAPNTGLGALGRR